MGFLVTVILVMTSAIWVPALAKKGDAYANDINECLLAEWQDLKVLKERVQCSGSQFCYSTNGQNPAQFVVCYNETTLIPDFTAHELVPNIKKPKEKRNNWRDESKAQSSTNDYRLEDQKFLYQHYDNASEKGQFCSRGHLTPNADFPTLEQRRLTYVITNAAPQWHLFNRGNWAKVEDAVRAYAENNQSKLYIFTGTGFNKSSSGNVIKLKDKVYAPDFFWKVVCDPDASTKGKAVVIMGNNSIDDISDDQIKSNWNSETLQTKKEGVIQLYGLEEAKAITKTRNFHLPPLGQACNPADERGAFLDELLNVLLRSKQ